MNPSADSTTPSDQSTVTSPNTPVNPHHQPPSGLQEDVPTTNGLPLGQESPVEDDAEAEIKAADISDGLADAIGACPKKYGAVRHYLGEAKAAADRYAKRELSEGEPVEAS